MRGTIVALLRGINVGRAKRVAMADLRALVEALGYSDVRTVLNSGNVVFSAPGVAPAEAARRIAAELVARTGVAARVTVLDAAELDEVMTGNPLLTVAGDASLLLVAVLAEEADRERLESLAEQDWGDEALAVGRRVAYLWCPGGTLAGRLWESVGRALGDRVTTRNWATMTRLHALVGRSK